MKKILSITLMLVNAFVIHANAQCTISGKVTDRANGSELPGVGVSVEGTTIATATDINGNYILNLPNGEYIIKATYLGYKPYQSAKITLANSSKFTLDISLEIDEDKLEDVVIVGYGKTKRRRKKVKGKKYPEVLVVHPKHHSRKAAKQRKSYSSAQKKMGMKPVANNRAAKDPKDSPVSDSNTEEYDKIIDNPFVSPYNTPLSTFSIDVDAASYSNMRRMINDGQLPVKDAVRIEEMINYFHYDYPNPQGEHPFSVTTELGSCPWNEDHKLVHIGLQGKKLDYENLAASNLVFLLDVSGSMSYDNKLPLVKKSMKALLNELSEDDRVAIVVYAGAAGVVLESTPATEKEKIMSALDNLEAGGSTAGGEGIRLAYDIAMKSLIPDGNNRIILATDGDFNVGTSSTSELVQLVEEKRKDGIYLTLCGFGMGNYKDGRMEQISNAGNGNYFYIDNIREAQKVFVTEMRATLFTIAKDVKIQVEFNPKQVQAYRLIGYVNRKLSREDFDDDTKDAGELGAGHTVTALYEIIPRGVESDLFQPASGLKYQRIQTTDAAGSDELMTVKLRYKKPSEDTSILLSTVINNANGKWENTSENFRFSAAVAEFGMLLRGSEFKGTASYDQVVSMANGAKGKDEEGYRSEFVQLVRSGMLLADR